MSEPELTPDDIFLLGNIAVKAVAEGHGSRTKTIAQLIRQERPENAGGLMIDAMRLMKEGDLQGAIQVLEQGAVFKARENRDGALLLYLSLLTDDGQIERVRMLAAAILEDNIDLSADTQDALAFFVQLQQPDPASTDRLHS